MRLASSGKGLAEVTFHNFLGGTKNTERPPSVAIIIIGKA
jgi:hypothetical protein